MMKFGFRIPSIKKRIAARTSWKRLVRHSLGLKAPRGFGFVTNPKKALYNKVYQKVTIDVPNLTNLSNGSTQMPKLLSFPLILILLLVLPPVGLILLVIWAYYLYKNRKVNMSSQDSKDRLKSKTGGYIGYFGLDNWWLSEFSDDGRKLMENLYHPMGKDPNEKSLTEGVITYTSLTASNFLNGLSSWFTGPEHRDLARKILKKAEEINRTETGIKSVLDEHFNLSETIPVYYRDREKPGMLDKAMDACKKQIELAPLAARQFLKEYPGQPLPTHRGYEQLVIILAKEGKYGEAVELCQQAKKQGWAGDWENRIDRYQRSLP